MKEKLFFISDIIQINITDCAKNSNYDYFKPRRSWWIIGKKIEEFWCYWPTNEKYSRDFFISNGIKIDSENNIISFPKMVIRTKNKEALHFHCKKIQTLLDIRKILLEDRLKMNSAFIICDDGIKIRDYTYKGVFSD